MNSDFAKLSKEERALRFTALALGELAPAEAEEVHQAIAVDPELAREFARLKQTVALVRETAAMDRKVSSDGTPLRLDEARRKKLLETFQTPAPVVVKPRRRRKLWFVPMSAAALLIGLLVVSVTELGNIGPWRMTRERARQATAVHLWDGETKPYVTGTYFSGEEKDSKKRANVLREARPEMLLGRRGSPGAAPETAGRDFDADGFVKYTMQSPASSQPSDSRAKMEGASAIALPAVTAREEAARVEISGQWIDGGNNQGVTWNSSGAGLPGEQSRRLLPQVAAKAETFGGAKSSGLLSPTAPAASPVAIDKVMGNPAPAPARVGQASVEPQRTTVTVSESPAANFVVSADNTSQPAGFPATAPAELSKEITERFGRPVGSVKGMDGEESKNRDSQGKSESSPAATRGYQIQLSDIDAPQTGLRDTKDSPARNLYLGGEPAAASKAVASTPPAEGLKNEGATVYSVNAVGYANLALKPGYNLIDNPLNQPSNSRELPKSDASPAGAGPKPFSENSIAPTATDPNRVEAAKLVQDGKLYYEAGRLKEAEDALRQATKIDSENKGAAYHFDLVTEKKDAAEARLRGIGSKQLLTEVEQASSSPVVRDSGTAVLPAGERIAAEQGWDTANGSLGMQAGSAPSFGSGGIGGGATRAPAIIAPSGGGRGNRTPGNLVGETLGDDSAQPARPETRIVNGVIDSRSLAGAIDGLTGPQAAVEAKFMDVTPDNSLALGIDSFRNGALKNQTLDQDRAVRSADVGSFYSRYAPGDVGAPALPASGTVVYQDGADYVSTNGVLSNQAWGFGVNPPAANDSSWFGKDVRENPPADAYHFSSAIKPTPPLSYRWRATGDEPAPVTFANQSHKLTGSVGLADGSVQSGGGDLFRNLALNSDVGYDAAAIGGTASQNDFLVPAQPTGGDKSSVANVTAFSVGQSQHRRSGARGFASSDSGNAYRSIVSGATDRVTGGAGGTAVASEFFDDSITAATGVRGDAVNVNGRVAIQLPAPANESPLNRQSSPTRPLNEATRADVSGPRNIVVETLLGVDAAGLPIADFEAKGKKIEAVKLGDEFIVAEDKLEEKKVSASTVETGKPMPLRAGMQVQFANPSPTMMATNAAIASVAPGNRFFRLTAGEVAPGSMPIPVAANDTNLEFVRDAQAAAEAVVRPRQLPAPQILIQTNGWSAITSGKTQTVASTGGRLLDGPPAKPSAPAPTPQPEVLARENAFSTFSLNVSDVSFKLAAASLEKGAMPGVANIRSEEFINAFDYRDPMPAAGAPIAFAWERARYPFAHNRDVVRFSVKTAAQGREAGKPLNIVLLLDNSGSMERADRVRIIQESLRTLAAQLKPQDKLSVVTFSRTARLWADGVSGAQAAEVANRIGALTPEGGTNLEDALDLAYKTALRHYAATAMNRVVLLTDGAANLGNVEPKELKAKVEGFRKQGIALDCFGIGWEGLNDDLLEQLSRNGDGRYGFVNTPEEAASEFVGQLAGALRVAASDVKMQVEFNPKRVTAWRQIGYAKHQLTKQQFRDNKVDAAEIGAAESGNALYVIETNPNGQGPIATVRARFRVPQTSDYREHEWVVPFGSAVELEQASPSLRLAAGASAFSEWLASSPFAGDVSTDRLLKIVSGVPEIYGADPRPKKLEWMIRQAKSISGK